MLLGGELAPIPVRYHIREYECAANETNLDANGDLHRLRSTKGRVTRVKGHQGWDPIDLVPQARVTLVMNNGHRIHAILESSDGLLNGARFIGPIEKTGET